MSDFSNNHFVPRLVLRRFADKITTFDIDTGEFIENRKCEKVFAAENIYPTDIEQLFNKNIEGRFADILNNKILKAVGQCELSREENLIIKKFLLIAQMRTLETIEFTNVERHFSKMLNLGKAPFEEKHVDSETTRDRWLRNLRVILECKDIGEIEKHEQVTHEVYRWAMIYYSGYLSIWTNEENEEDFIITDVGMTSERDLGLFLNGISDKQLYLYDKLSKRSNNIYRNILATQMNFHENFYMFSISKNRMITIINPFYRLFDKKDTPLLSTPKIWPSKIKDRTLVGKNKYRYVNIKKNKMGITNPKDIFIYKINQMNLDDTVYVNKLMLDRINKVVGFADLAKVKNSIVEYNSTLGKRINYDSLVKTMKKKKII
ncbi:DUF4238 domain-containing protein [Mycoplasmatota bacterium zrk1]